MGNFDYRSILVNSGTIVQCRHGDNGNYLYFATTGLKLNYQDENIDVENLGNSTLVTFMVITLVLLVGYIIDGVEIIQDSILEVNEHC